MFCRCFPDFNFIQLVCIRTFNLKDGLKVFLQPVKSRKVIHVETNSVIQLEEDA